MKTEKQVRTWWIIDKAIGDDKVLVKNTYLASSDKPSDETIKMFPNSFIKVISHEDHLAIMRQLQEEASAKIATLETRITKLREALEFYADLQTYHEYGMDQETWIQKDKWGDKARQALVEIEDETLAEDGNK